MNGRIALSTLVLWSPLGLQLQAGQAEIHLQARDHGDYVGTRACAECHRPEFDAWQGSQHDRAMQPATAETVLGDFDDARFDYYGVESRFFRDRERFMVRTDSPDGQLQDYAVVYTFGVEPRV